MSASAIINAPTVREAIATHRAVRAEFDTTDIDAEVNKISDREMAALAALCAAPCYSREDVSHKASHLLALSDTMGMGIAAVLDCPGYDTTDGFVRSLVMRDSPLGDLSAYSTGALVSVFRAVTAVNELFFQVTNQPRCEAAVEELVDRMCDPLYDYAELIATEIASREDGRVDERAQVIAGSSFAKGATVGEVIAALQAVAAKGGES